jgi:hypothetical protein
VSSKTRFTKGRVTKHVNCTDVSSFLEHFFNDLHVSFKRGFDQFLLSEFSRLKIFIFNHEFSFSLFFHSLIKINFQQGERLEHLLWKWQTFCPDYKSEVWVVFKPWFIYTHLFPQTLCVNGQRIKNFHWKANLIT